MMAEGSVVQVVNHDIGHFAHAFQSSSYLHYIIFIALCSIFLGYFLDNYGSLDSREPEKLRSSLPFVGHLVGMIAKHTQYYDIL